MTSFTDGRDSGGRQTLYPSALALLLDAGLLDAPSKTLPPAGQVSMHLSTGPPAHPLVLPCMPAAGLLLVTHLTLLLGMAAPVWLSNALDRGALGGAADAAGAGERVWPAAYAGILVVGERRGQQQARDLAMCGMH